MADAASERGRVTSFASLKLVQMCEVILPTFLSQENFFAKVKTLHKGKDGTESEADILKTRILVFVPLPTF